MFEFRFGQLVRIDDLDPLRTLVIIASTSNRGIGRTRAARYVEIDGAAHGVPIQKSDQINALLLKHIAEAWNHVMAKKDARAAMADEILFNRGRTVIPDILANAGGVTVSYFEWVQDFSSYFWEESEVDSRLEKYMTRAYHAVAEQAARYKCSLRDGAYVLAVDRVAEATRVRGIFP